MASTRWRKVRRDLSRRKGRTLLVMAAITVGVAATGSILTAYSVTTREMDRNYTATNPASAILHVESADDELVASVTARPEIGAAEARREITARLVRGRDEWIDLRLVVVADFDDVTVSRFYPDRGAWAPAGDEILIERSSLTEVDLSVGDDLTVAAPGGFSHRFTVAGLVHDPGRTPAWMTGVLVGYITPEGLPVLGLEPVLDELRVVIEPGHDRSANRRVADDLAADLERDGIEVSRVDVPVPGEHPAQGVMKTMLFLLQTFGALALITGGAVVATLISAQLKQQSREIGVMKAVGARTGQIAGIYVGTVAVLGVAAAVVGIPLGTLGGRGFIDFTFGLLNFEVESYRLDAWVIPVQIVAAVGIPLLAVAYPVAKNSRLPVRDIIADHGIVTGPSGPGGGGRLAGMRGLGRTATLGIRNAFRTRSRTALTVLAVSLGGAAFMVALNTGAAWDRAVDAEFESRRYDLEIGLDRLYPVGQLRRALEDEPTVGTVEVWTRYAAAMHLPGGGSGERFGLLVPPPDTELVDYPLLAGRWLRPGDRNALVVTQVLDDPAPAVGSAVTLDVDGVETSWTVVGRVRQLSGGPTGVAYASGRPVGVGETGFGNLIRVAGDSPSLLSTVEDRLAGDDIGITSIAAATDGREALDDHLLIIVGLLMVMAVLMSTVGGLGLIEAMSISVLERRRELGVMRAVGAGTGTVLQVVVVEGVLIAVLSWVVAILLSLPATVLVENVTGTIFVQAPLVTSFSPLGMGVWLAVALVLAAIASALPALEAVETPVHQALAYE